MLHEIIASDSAVKHVNGKSIAHKTSSDNIILVKPFLGACIKAINHYVSPDLHSCSTYW